MKGKQLTGEGEALDMTVRQLVRKLIDYQGGGMALTQGGIDGEQALVLVFVGEETCAIAYAASQAIQRVLMEKERMNQDET